MPDPRVPPPSRAVAAVAALAALVTASSTACGSLLGEPEPTTQRVAQSATPPAPRSALSPATSPSRTGSASPGSTGTGTGTTSTGSTDTTSAGNLQIAPEPASVTVAFAGDIHFEPPIRSRLAADPRTALGPVASVLSAADLAVVNLETAITKRGTAAPKAFRFRAPASALTALRAAGVDVASMANNHGLDFGPVGLRDSLAAAGDAGFPVIGIGADEAAAYAPYRTTINGSRLAVIAATSVLDDALIDSWTARDDQPGLASAKRVDRLTAAVRAARQDSEAVIVFLHWGQEKASCPTRSQQDLAGQLADAGADVVVGSHAHVLLGGGWHQSGAYVDYGLGNFVFYANSARSTESGVLTLTLRGRDVTDAAWTPARITRGIPLPQDGAQGRRMAASKERLRTCTDLRSTPTG